MRRVPPTPSALILAAALVLATVPALASHQQVKVPPRWTGAGNTDVRDEPSTAADGEAPTNGFEGKDYPGTWFDNASGELILDSFYEYNAAQVDVDFNNLLRILTAEAGRDEHEKHMLFGFGYFQAWWGWFHDGGQGHLTREQGLGSGDADGAIDDAHDNASVWSGDPQNGDWDEFVWRGENPWAPDHPRMPHPSKPDDEMTLFLQPGTVAPHEQQAPIPTRDDAGYVLRNDADDPQTPDLRFEDRTAYGAYAQRPLPQWGGWTTENGYPTGIMDNGYLVTTTVRTTVNPDEVDGGFDPASGTASDVDVYTAVDDSLATLYRTAVWDPGDEQDSPADAVHEEGPKQEAKDRWTALWTGGEDAAVETAEEAIDPLAPAAGLAADNAGRRPRTHEPNTAADVYGIDSGGSATGWATHDPNTTYGNLQGEDYYDPGTDQGYGGYAEERPWVDVQPGYGVPVYGFAFTMLGSGNLFPVPDSGARAQQGEQGAASPGLLTFAGHMGLWWDANGDTWVGDLGEQGRWTEPDDPYNRGLGDPTAVPDEPIYQDRANDPNDYTDTQKTTENDGAKAFPYEWRPLCGAGSLTLTVEPLTGDGRWGQAGVYVIRDRSGVHNPYDDVAADVLGDGPWGDDGDGERLSRHVQEGSITLDMTCLQSERGGWFSEDAILMPTGSANYDVEATAVAKVPDNTTSRTDDLALGGTQVRDVDVIPAWR